MQSWIVIAEGAELLVRASSENLNNFKHGDRMEVVIDPSKASLFRSYNETIPITPILKRVSTPAKKFS